LSVIFIFLLLGCSLGIEDLSVLPRERVLQTIGHRRPDRVPLYCWLFWLDQFPEIEQRFGTVRDFYERLQLDMVQTFPTEPLLPDKNINEHIPLPGDGARVGEASDQNCFGRVYTLEEAILTPFTDPDEADLYSEIRDDIRFHKEKTGRAVFVQTPGVFEAAGTFLGLQQELEATVLEPERLKGLFDKIARWTTRYIDNALDLGADVIHVSDDWGSNRGLLLSPETLRSQVLPYEKIIADHARRRGALLSLHSDGNIWKAMDLVLDLGFQVLHPVQRSAGMDAAVFKTQYGDRLCMYGGLDVRTTLGHGNLDAVRREIAYTMQHVKPGGGLIFCTSHTPMPHCSVDELIAAYDCAYELAAY